MIFKPGWHLDWASFFLGLISGLLLFFFIYRITISKYIIRNAIRNIVERFGNLLSPNLELQMRKDLIQFCQRNHIAANLFPLDDLLIEPRMLALPTDVDRYQTIQFDETWDAFIPSLPDYPEFASTYQFPDFHLSEALGKPVNLILMGKLGSGKTTALLDLILKLCRGEILNPNNVSQLPLYIHCSYLQIHQNPEKDILDLVIQASAHLFSKSLQRRLAKLVHKLLKEDRLIFLFDGLDELYPKHADSIIQFIGKLHDQYPHLQMIVSSSVNYLGDLQRFGFVPIWIKSWNKTDAQNFLEKWREAWLKLSRSTIKQVLDQTILTNAWLIQEFHLLNPLEWVLASWLMYNGNFINASPSSILINGIDLLNDTNKSNNELATITLKQLFTTSNAFVNGVANETIEPSQTSKKGKPPSQPAFSLSPIHPFLRCYLAAQVVQPSEKEFISLLDYHWAMGLQTATFVISKNETSIKLPTIDEFNLRTDLLVQSGALKYMPSNSEATQSILRECVKVISNPSLPLNMRSKLMINLASSPFDEIKSIIEYLLRFKDPTTLQLGALGFGLLHPPAPIEPLIPLLVVPNDNVYSAASRALAANGSSKSIDVLTNSLVNGHERLKIAAAQALAIHPQQGQAILREAVHNENPSIRKACVYGLVHINQPWRKELLEKLAIEDTQWMVKDSASNALEYLNAPNVWVPNSLKPILECSWFTRFVNEHDLAISDKSNAEELLQLILKEGNVEQKIAAIEAIRFRPFFDAISQLLALRDNPSSGVRESLYLTIWFISISNYLVNKKIG